MTKAPPPSAARPRRSPCRRAPGHSRAPRTGPPRARAHTSGPALPGPRQGGDGARRPGVARTRRAKWLDDVAAVGCVVLRSERREGVQRDSPSHNQPARELRGRTAPPVDRPRIASRDLQVAGPAFSFRWVEAPRRMDTARLHELAEATPPVGRVGLRHASGREHRREVGDVSLDRASQVLLDGGRGGPWLAVPCDGRSRRPSPRPLASLTPGTQSSHRPLMARTVSRRLRPAAG